MDPLFTQLTILKRDLDRFLTLDLENVREDKTEIESDGTPLVVIGFPETPNGVLGFEALLENHQIPYNKDVEGFCEMEPEYTRVWFDEQGSLVKKLWYGDDDADALDAKVVRAQFDAGTLESYLLEHEARNYIMPWNERLAVVRSIQQTPAVV